MKTAITSILVALIFFISIIITYLLVRAFPQYTFLGIILAPLIGAAAGVLIAFVLFKRM
jgi:glycerol uptake facilitator-like aquaporin